MQKIEKWRVEELCLLLDLLAALLRLGKNPEWANVFFHFNEEAELILSAGAFDIGPIKMLVRNIKNCFGADGNFVTLELDEAEPPTKHALNLEFAQARARLWNALQELEKGMVEFVN